MKKSFFVALLISFFPLLHHSLAAHYLAPQKRCHVNRALFDVGSGATKFKLVKVDTCQQKILELLFEKAVSVPYQKSLNQAPDDNFSPEVIEAGLNTLKSLKLEAEKFGPIDEAFGLATAAFRNANNGQAVLEKFERELGIKIIIVSQEMEATLGLRSTRFAEKDPSLKHILVWDIGGGSQQFITDTHPDGLVYAGAGIGAETFEKFIIENVKNADSSIVESPNPIGPNNVPSAIKLAQRHISFPGKNFSRLFHYEQRYHPKVIGIGSVHKSILKLVNPGEDSYNKEALLQAALKYSAKSDDELIKMGAGADFADHNVSNMLFVYAVMDTLKIDRIHVRNVAPIDAWIVENSLELQINNLHNTNESEKQLH
jgi:exopolyphosphatase/guanosine-5'-triphosphate,3'-diphosphate pyrophosphatase